MNLIGIFLATVFYTTVVCAQISLSHSTYGGPESFVALSGMAHASDGHFYVVGTFVDSFTANGTTLSTSYNSAIYAAKFSLENLAMIWLERIAESSGLFLNSAIAIDMDNNPIIGIGFENSLYLFNDSVNIPGNEGVHLLKLDPDGAKIWAFGTDARLLGKKGLAVDNENNIALTGSAENDVYVAKYDTEGSLIWERNGGSMSASDDGYFVDIDPEGNIYVSGRIYPSSNIYFDGLHVAMPVSAYFATFVAKYTSDGNIQWVRYVYSQTFAKFAIISSIHVLDNGSIIVSGSYDESLLRFSNGFSPVGNNQSGYYAGFLACFAPNGDRVWARKLHNNTNGHDGGVNGLTSIGDHIYLTDEFGGTITLDPDVYTAEGYDILLERYDLNGNLMSSVQIGGAEHDHASQLFISGPSIYILGVTQSHPFYVGTGSFDADTPSSMYVISLMDGFVGIPDLYRTSDRIQLFPNPNNGTFQISDLKVDGQLMVKDVHGKVVSSSTVSALDPSPTVTLLNVQPGMYFVTLSTADTNYAFKVIVL